MIDDDCIMALLLMLIRGLLWDYYGLLWDCYGIVMGLFWIINDYCGIILDYTDTGLIMGLPSGKLTFCY